MCKIHNVHCPSFQIGKCDVIEQVMIGDEVLLKFSGVPLGEACSIVIRGATEQILGEAERSLHDALCVLTSTVKNTKTVLGGGQFLLGAILSRTGVP